MPQYGPPLVAMAGVNFYDDIFTHEDATMMSHATAPSRLPAGNTISMPPPSQEAADEEEEMSRFLSSTHTQTGWLINFDLATSSHFSSHKCTRHIGAAR